jgi:hypothetical protein
MMRPGYCGFVMGFGLEESSDSVALPSARRCYCTKYVSASTKLRLSMAVPQL